MRGFTLLELMVALAVLGLLSGVSALAFGRLRRPDSADPPQQMAAAQRKAVRSGRRVVLTLGRDTVSFLPDGRAVGRGADPLTGEARAATK